MTENPYRDESNDLENAKSMDEIVKTVFAPIYPRVKSRMNPEKMERIITALDESDIPGYVINKSDAGFWIHIFKE